MAEHYSGLEVAHTEHVQSSPEAVNHSSFAPQRASLSHDSPEVVSQPTFASDTAHQSLPNDGNDVQTKQWSPQLSPPHYSGFKSPGLHKDDGGFGQGTEPLTDKETRPKDDSVGKRNDSPKRRKILFWVVVGLIALIVVAIGVGVGVGVGIRNRNAGKSGQSSSASPTPTPDPANSSLPHGLMDDTSVAILASANGDKHLFFQENSGSIRQALYDPSSEEWTSDVNNMVVTNAKNGTPIVAFQSNTKGSTKGGLGKTIWLFYIADNNYLASRQFVSGTWTTRDNFSPTGSPNITFPTANNTRALAVTATADSSGAWVFYVAQNGTAVALNVVPDGEARIVATVGSKLPSSMQGDKVLGLAAGASTGKRPQVGVLCSNGTVYYSLYFSFWIGDNWSKPQLQTLLVPPLPADEVASLPKGATSLTLADAYPATATTWPTLPSTTVEPSQRSASYNESLIGDVNIAQVFINTGSSDSYTLFGFWVNGTSLAAYTTRNIGLSTMPKSPFPYSRLAGTTVGNSSNIYLYHQINGTSIAEDMYNTDGGFFTTTYMSIAVSTD